jgi:UDP-glucose 4-epimerase
MGHEPIIFGNTYNTKDGFALREYIDVQDLTQALTLPITKDLTGIHNLSSGKILSTLEVVGALLDISGRKKINVKIEGKKSQDPSIIGSQASQVIANLGWHPKVTLRESVENFWEIFTRYYFSNEAVN